jgi:hypothetical protein
MRSQEVRALGELTSEALGGAAARIEEMHGGIAERVFESVGETAAPIRVIHDGIAHGVYAGVRSALGGAVRAAAGAISLTRPPDAPSIERAPAGRVAIGALNGAFGDRLEQERSPFAVRMSARRGGEAIELNADAVRAAFPDATAQLAVFLHGLGETEGRGRSEQTRIPRTARGCGASSATRRSTSATTAAATSRITAGSSRSCSTNCARPGPSRRPRSR